MSLPVSLPRLFSALAGVLAGTVAIAVAGGVVAGGAVSAASARPGAASGAGAPGSSPRTLPEHVFAPYFEAYTTDSPAALAQQSGARFLTLAFIQAPAAGSCAIDWNGDPATPIGAAIYGSDIAAIRAAGGDVVPSFGGYSADHGGTEIADSCTSVALIAAAYENVITTYNLTRLDLDTEDNSLTNNAGVDRRNKAIKMVQDWAATRHRTVQFVYTLPTNVSGLNPTGVHVLADALANHARVDIVNIMTFDYYDNKPHEMAADTVTAAQHLYDTLHQLYPRRPARALWSMMGITEMVGIDDFGPPEIFTTADAATVEQWAAGRHLAELSFWALQRDNGGCPGTKGAGNCSGVTQSPWQFSHTFEPFTSRGAHRR
ncbi:MAG TPA: chitinase [Streptosporangiaceae bacterium]|nr:chitinase [Streptosporangiaceae bacterium]